MTITTRKVGDMSNKIILRFYCKEHGYVSHGFDEPITEVHFNQRGELGLACPLCHKSRPMTIERYTGLNDKKGNPIFENDIVRWKIGGLKLIGIIEWGEGEWIKGMPGYNMQAARTYQSSTEVVGNLWQNAELLTAPR